MIPTAPGSNGSSTRPYLIRALHDWCTDNGFTPYIAVYVDASVKVPVEYVKNNEIVLNVSFEATTGMKLGNEYIEFKARFGGSSRDIVVPVDHVIAIYARENGQGMAFPAPTEAHADESEPDSTEKPGAGLRLASTDGMASQPASGGGKSDGLPARDSSEVAESDTPEPPGSGGGRPSLKRIK